MLILHLARVTRCIWKLLLLLFLLTPAGAFSQVHVTSLSPPKGEIEADSVTTLLVSDIHFDPFFDPAKFSRLVSAPVTQWKSILVAPASADQADRFAELQRRCYARGVDTPYALLQSSLQAMRMQQSRVKFMVISGDLLAHSFDCKYKALVSRPPVGSYQEFVLKTMSFIVQELQDSSGGIPLYLALGNNDSDCGDYQMDANSAYLAGAARILTATLPVAQREQAALSFAAGGYYTTQLSASMHNTRLIVLNDVFMSAKYRSCSGKADATAAANEITWLQSQLSAARKAREKIWVMGHIPPGVDPFSTVLKLKDVCGTDAPVMFLSSDKLADTLLQYADIITLGIFGHSHMDEVRYLHRPADPAATIPMGGIAVKILPSISPVDGNTPSFTVAQVNPSTGTLRDYQVIEASNKTGIATTWAEEYDYDRTYSSPGFSSMSVAKTLKEFTDDAHAATDGSKAYIRNFFVGDQSPVLKPLWPQYVCALGNDTAKAFASCVCNTGK